MMIKLWIALLGVFAGFVLLVQAMGYVAYSLSPRDPAAIQRASEFEAAMGRHRDAPKEGIVPLAPVEIPIAIPKWWVRYIGWSNGRAGDLAKPPCSPNGCARAICPRCQNACPKIPWSSSLRNKTGPYGGTWTRFATWAARCGHCRSPICV